MARTPKEPTGGTRSRTTAAKPPAGGRKAPAARPAGRPAKPAAAKPAAGRAKAPAAPARGKAPATRARTAAAAPPSRAKAPAAKAPAAKAAKAPAAKASASRAPAARTSAAKPAASRAKAPARAASTRAAPAKAAPAPRGAARKEAPARTTKAAPKPAAPARGKAAASPAPRAAARPAPAARAAAAPARGRSGLSAREEAPKAPARAAQARPAAKAPVSKTPAPKTSATKAPAARKAPARAAVRTVTEVAAQASARAPARGRAAKAVPDETAARIAELEATPAPTSRKRATVAGPKKRGSTPPRPSPSPDRLEELVRAAVTSLEDDKAEDVVVLDVASRSAFADRMVVATGLVERQIEAMARHVEEALAEHGVRRIRTEASPDWVLLDAGDLVIHLFKPEARQNYALERMWGPESPAAEETTMPPRDPEEGAEEITGMAGTGDEDLAGDDDDLGDDADDDLEDEGDDDDDLVDDDEDEDDDVTDDEQEASAAPDPRKPMVDRDAPDAQAGDAQDRLYIGEIGDGRPAGDGNGAILPPGEALDGPAGFAFNTTGEDLQPTFPDEESGGAATLSEGADTRKKGGEG